MLIKTRIRKSSGSFMAFGVWWPATVEEASIHLDCIQAGGKWTNQSTGEEAGMGLYYHYRRFQEIVWPEIIWEKGPFKNYWAEKILECWIQSTYLGLMGCASSGKSSSLGSISLTDWYAFPDCTTTLVSSTDLKMLELRIWGMIKKFHRLAKQRYSWLPGHLIEGKQIILNNAKDEYTEGRDHMNAIIGVPCKRGNQFVGLGCFPEGTLVDAEYGPTPIESLKPGDKVWSALGLNRIRRCSTRIAESLVRLHLSDGRKIDCTPNHPFFTSLGWVSSIDLSPKTYIYSAHETLSILQEGHAGMLSHQKVLQRTLRASELQESLPLVQAAVYPIGRQKHFLREILLSELEGSSAGNTSEDGGEQRLEINRKESFSMALRSSSGIKENSKTERVETQRPEMFGDYQENLDYEKEKWTGGIWRNREHSEDSTGINIAFNFSRGNLESSNSSKDRPSQERWLALRESRPWVERFETGRGTGRREASKAGDGCEGFKTRQATQGAWLVRVEVLQRAGDERYNESKEGYRVHNLEIEGHPSYSVNGLVSHNSYIGLHNKHVRLIADECQLMSKSFLDSTANLSKCQDFKMAAPGNPNETTNAHGTICEPATELGGWQGGIDQGPGTKVWKTRYPNGYCLQLPGSDSPNLHAPENEEPPFPFLITRKQMQEDAQVWGQDDWHYAMFDDAKMPRGQGSHRVITRQECEKHGATLEAMWRDSNITKIAALDAAYTTGGDRCVFTEINFGREVESNVQLVSTNGIISQKSNVPQGRQILSIVDQIVIPIDGGLNADTPEAQIVKAVKTQCENRGIVPANFFFDSGMKTALVQQFSRDWSLDVQSIDCGSAPTDQRVSMEIDKPCHDHYKKLITELWFSIRLVIMSRQFRNLNADLMWELCAREWKNSPGNKIEVESKEEMKIKTGKSPDLADCLAVAIFGARQRGFQISRLHPVKPAFSGPDWRQSLRDKAKKIWASGMLEYNQS